MTVKIHKHWAVFLLASALLLGQFIAELIGVYVIFDFKPTIALYFYKFAVYLALVHFFFSVILVVWARRLASRFYRET